MKRLVVLAVKKKFYWPHPYVPRFHIWKWVIIGFRYYLDGKEVAVDRCQP